MSVRLYQVQQQSVQQNIKYIMLVLQCHTQHTAVAVVVFLRPKSTSTFSVALVDAAPAAPAAVDSQEDLKTRTGHVLQGVVTYPLFEMYHT